MPTGVNVWKWLTDQGAGILTVIGLALVILAGVLAVLDRSSTIITPTFGCGGALLFGGVFGPRMFGRTKLPGGIETNLALDPGLTARQPIDTAAAEPPPKDDPATVAGRWPTYASAFNRLPTGWTREQQLHKDGQQYDHIRAPQGLELTIPVNALHLRAPRWLMVALNTVDDE